MDETTENLAVIVRKLQLMTFSQLHDGANTSAQ
jgi:hypothetical protein